MDLLLTEQQSLFAETAARLCADHGGPRRAARAAGGRRARWTAKPGGRRSRRSGWRPSLRKRHGGQGLGAFDLALALEQAGRQLLMVPLVEAAAAAWTLSRAADGVARAGGARRRAARRRPHRTGDRGGILAARGPRVRRPLRPQSRRARRKHSVRRLCRLGRRVPRRGRFRSAARTGGRPAQRRFRSRPKATSTVRRRARLAFADVESRRRRDRDRGARRASSHRELQEFLTLGAAIELFGLAAAALEVTLDYIKLRQQFGKPIGSFQVLQHRAVDGFIDIELNRSLVYRVLAAFDAGEHHPAMVSAAKARASRCGVGDRSRRAADARRHRLYRGARHRPLLQACR